MALGLPVVLLTAYVAWVTRRAATASPTFTPGGSPTTATHGALATMALKASPHVSWLRTVRGGVAALAVFVTLVAGYMVLRSLGIGPAGSLRAAGALAAEDRILVADFRVTGTDSSLGSALAEGVRIGLRGSDAVTVLSLDQMASTLRRMERPTGTRVDDVLAREIALRDQAKAIVSGEVAAIGTGFIVRVRLTTTDSAKELFSEQRTAEGRTS
jgi:hypothetical protein